MSYLHYVFIAYVCYSFSRVQLCDNGLLPSRLLCPWNFPGKNIGMDCHFLLQGIFPTQESHPGLLHYRQILYWLSYEGSWFWLFGFIHQICWILYDRHSGQLKTKTSVVAFMKLVSGDKKKSVIFPYVLKHSDSTLWKVWFRVKNKNIN